jgi:uncharacterized protein DUF4439
MTTADALAEALSAEHAAIFGYGAVGAHVTNEERTAAMAADEAHRQRRDRLVGMIVEVKATPPAAQAAYDLPFAVTDRTSALRLATALEDRTARAWYRALMSTDGDQRRFAVEALTDCAVRATRWRKAAGTQPATVAFPGTTD